jgi:hypothetical protein
MLSKLVYEIGIIVLVALLYSIPILTVFSFIYMWPSFFKFILIVVSVIELIALSEIIEDMASRGE